MLNNVLKKLFGSTDSKKASSDLTHVRSRRLHLEPLENREMLAVTATDFAAIKSQYADLNLTKYGDYNIIEITAAQLSDAAIRNAIATAASTTANDLIVCRTTASQNIITLGGTELAININVSTHGSIMIVSLGTEKLTLNANQKSRVFNVLHYNAEVSLAGLTISNGLIDIPSSNERPLQVSGGGIYNKGALTLTCCIISDNVAYSAISSAAGGGIYCDYENSNGMLTITHSTISNNRAVSESDYSESIGGGVYAPWGTIKDCLIIENAAIASSCTNSYTNGGSSSSSTGGGVFGISDMYNSSVIRNSASSTSQTIASDTKNASAISESNGGGLYLVNNIYNCTVSGNTATATSLHNGSPEYGAGVYSKTGSGGVAGAYKMVNCTITDNSVMAVSHSFGTLPSDSWKNDVSAIAYGGGISDLHGAEYMFNTIVANNRANAITQCDNYTATIVKLFGGSDVCLVENMSSLYNERWYNNIISQGLSQGLYIRDHNAEDKEIVRLVFSGNGNIVGSELSPIDAKLGKLALAANGLWYHPLLANSQAINSGENALVGMEGVSRFNDIRIDYYLKTDQIGNPRISNVTVDIGAFEYTEVIGELDIEYLCKLWVYEDDGQRVEFGKNVKNAEHEETAYIVKEIFVNNRGLYAVGLVKEAKDGKPQEAILAFRGTQGPGHDPDILDFISDLNPLGVGYDQYYHLDTLQQIRNWASEVSTQGDLKITGHSLGGALAQRCAVDLSTRGVRITEVETFNSPGISNAEAKRFVKGNTKVTHHIVNGDLFSLAGEAFIAGTNYLYTVSATSYSQ